jgi:AbrB family looped-hinge helix DNA binding protein
MTEVSARVSPGGRIVVPAEFRKALGLEVGNEVLISLEDGGIRISTRKQQLTRAQELVRSHVPAKRSLAFDQPLALACARPREPTRAAGPSLGDRACLALGQQLSRPVLTTDRSWSGLDLGIEVHLAGP